MRRYQNSNRDCSYLSMTLGKDLVLPSVYKVGAVWSGCCLPLRKLFIVYSSSRWLFEEVADNPVSNPLSPRKSCRFSPALCFTSRRSHNQQKLWPRVRVYSRVYSRRGARRQPSVEDSGDRRAGTADWHEGHRALQESHFSRRYSISLQVWGMGKQAMFFIGKQMWGSTEFLAHRIRSLVRPQP